MNPWSLPAAAELDGKRYALHADYRDILEIISYLEDPDLPEALRWRIAVALFYEPEVPAETLPQAAQYLADFIAGGEEAEKPGPKLLDWDQDAGAILADVNRVAGREIRGEKFLHWWTFLSWFHAVGEGRLSVLVSIRDKLRRGKKLDGWERDFYRENKAKVDLRQKYSAGELAERERLNRLLDGGESPPA